MRRGMGFLNYPSTIQRQSFSGKLKGILAAISQMSKAAPQARSSANRGFLWWTLKHH